VSASLTPPFPGFDEPLEMLRTCHDRIERQCSTLDRLVPHLEAHGCDAAAREAAAAVLRYFDQAGPHHHADEESELFPQLLAALPGDEATRVKVLVQHLVADHREMEALWARLRKTLEPLARGEASSLDMELVTRFVGLYARHMTAEESEVLTLAERFLPHKVLVEIGQAMAQRRGVKRVVGD
jgi:hemerythrin-like domain-containing protein